VKPAPIGQVLITLATGRPDIALVTGRPDLTT
jgi:hypothetical protein